MNKFIFLIGLVFSTVTGYLFSSEFTAPALMLLFFSLLVLLGRLDTLSRSV